MVVPGRAAIRWYACAIGVLLVGGRLVWHGDAIHAVGAAFTPLANDRFGSMVVVAVMYLVAGWFYRRLRLATGDAAGKDAERAVDGVLGVLANLVLAAAVGLEARDWFDGGGSLGLLARSDPRMEEMALYSILWSVHAGLLIAAGFALRYPLYRILGLAAFGPLLLKVFFVDLNTLDLMSRVLALAVVGLILMAASALYQKFSARMPER